MPRWRRYWAWAWWRSAIRTASARWCWASAGPRPETSTRSPRSRLRWTSSASSGCAPSRAELHRRQCAEPGTHAPCIFEYVYFARPDSMIENISVHKARMRMGVTLGEKILRLRPDHDIDTVIPIPDTSRDAALELANL